MANGALAPEEETARECGLRLIEISGIYEDGVVGYGAPHATLAIAGLVARQRRLLKAAYQLADGGNRLEASILQRSMLEFLIVQKWLALDSQTHFLLWAADDLRARLRIDREMREQVPEARREAILRPEVGERYEESLEQMEAQLEQAREELGVERVPPLPSLREMADAVDLGATYSLAYRFDSQSAAHPSPLAIEQLMQDRPELGGIGLLAEPPPERGRADPYAVCAVILREALSGAAALIPELRLDGFDEVVARLEELYSALGAQ